MKKVILIAITAAITNASVAQVSFGVHAGANIGMGKYKLDEASFSGSTSHSQKNKAKAGFLGGFIAEIPLTHSLAFRPELNFFQEGTTYQLNIASTFGASDLEAKFTLNYIQLPLNIVYKVPAGPGSVFFGLGPVVQFGLSGKAKTSSATNPNDPDLNRTLDIKFDGKKSDDITDPNDQDGHFNRVDAGINILAGYKLAMGVFFKLGYSHGFIEAEPNKKNQNPSDRSYYKNSGLNVSVGYMFSKGGKKK